MSTFTTAIQYCSGNPTRAGKRNKMHSNCKEVKLSVFTDGTALHVENPKKCTRQKTPLDLMNKFSKYTGYEINTQ